MGFLRFFSKTIVSLVFIFSGFVKIIDPLGTAYKFEEYFIAFGLDFLIPLALSLSFIMCGIEFLIGVTLFFNIKIRIGSWAVLIFMSFFTFLTLILALTNPVTDCGCFGDAIIMSNWATFLKNVILMIFVIILFTNRSNFNNPLSTKNEWILIIVLSVGILLFESYNYRHLPLMDFRPYKVGNNIPELMKIPTENIPDPVLYYKNRKGETHEFSENFPSSDDPEWTFVDAKEIEIPEAAIHDFDIFNDNGNNITDEVLSRNHYTFLLISKDLNTASRKYQEEINEIARNCTIKGHDFMCLTSSVSSDIQKFKSTTGAPYSFYFTDPITLKTIIRANPGIMLIKSGTIIQKWHYNDLPSVEELNNKFNKY